MTEFIGIVIGSMIGTMIGMLIITWIYINCYTINKDE